MIILSLLLLFVQSEKIHVDDVIQLEDLGEMAEFKEIEPDEYVRLLDDNDHIRFVIFHLPRCRYCRQMKHTLKTVQEHIPEIEYNSINCRVNINFCKGQRIHSYPTMYIMKGRMKKQVFDEKSEKIEETIHRFINYATN